MWSQQAYLKASNTDAGDDFGTSVAVSADTVVVGAFTEASASKVVDNGEDDNSAPFAGAAYVFARQGSTWSQQGYLKASNTDANDYFGLAVAVWGDTAVVTSNQEMSSATGIDGDQTINTLAQAGAAYVFQRSQIQLSQKYRWSPVNYVKASNTDMYDAFGSSVSLWGDTCVIGARSEASAATGIDGDQSDNSAPVAGAVYVFR